MDEVTMLLPAEITVLILVLFLLFRWLYGLLTESKTKERIDGLDRDIGDLYEKYRNLDRRVAAQDTDTDDIDARLDAARIPQAPEPPKRREFRPTEPEDYRRPSQRPKPH